MFLGKGSLALLRWKVRSAGSGCTNKQTYIYRWTIRNVRTRTQPGGCDQRKCENCSGKTAFSKHCGETKTHSGSEGGGGYCAIRTESAQSDCT